MSDTTIRSQPGFEHQPANSRDNAMPSTQDSSVDFLKSSVLKPLASLRLTVFLFALSLLLVFFGTMAQIDNGIGTVMKQYFRSFIVWVPFKLLLQFGQVFFALPRTWNWPGSIPFPAGWTIGTLLLVNLIAAHLVRFKVSWKRSGILMLHAGLIILMLGELFTGLFAVEARMVIAQGETANFTDVSDRVELAILSPDKENPAKDHVVAIPDAMLRSRGKRITNEKLPFDVEVIDFWKNSNLIQPPHRSDPPNPRNGSDGQVYGLQPTSESSGVDSEARSDYPAARIAFYRKGTDEKLGEFLTSFWYYPNLINRALEFPPQTVTVDGTPYEIELRPKREYKDYSITLKEFKHDKYLGTSTAKNFSSLVTLNGVGDERRDVNIYMNNPLRYRGETFYQSSFFPDNSGTILQVVRNPAWLMPYLSCAVVTLGMAVHFGLTLVNFLGRRITK